MHAYNYAWFKVQERIVDRYVLHDITYRMHTFAYHAQTSCLQKTGERGVIFFILALATLSRKDPERQRLPTSAVPLPQPLWIEGLAQLLIHLEMSSACANRPLHYLSDTLQLFVQQEINPLLARNAVCRSRYPEVEALSSASQ